jgi:hypothetical protein
MRKIGGTFLWIATAIGLAAPVQAMHFDPAGSAALREVSTAQDAISRAYMNLLRGFESSSDYQQAISQVRKSTSDFEQARSLSLKSFHESAKYKSAQIEIWKIQEQLESTNDVDRVGEIASQLLQKRVALSKMETEILSNDQTTRQARYAMLDAQAKAAALRQNFVESIRSDPQWRAARRQLEQARTRFVSAGR